MSKLTDDVKEVVEPIIIEKGMELVDIELKKEYGQDNLYIYIDKDGGVDLNDCELIHNAVNDPIDKLDPIKTPYNLCISSPGLDRPLKTKRDFEKKMNQDVEVSLYKAINKIKKFEGKLVAYDGDTCDIEVKGKIIKLNIKDIALIRAAIKF